MAFDRFNDKPARREKRDGDRFGGKGGRFEEFGRGRGEGRFGDRGEARFGARKPFVGRPFKEELGGRSVREPRLWIKRRFSDRAAFVQNATVRLDSDVARYFQVFRRCQRCAAHGDCAYQDRQGRRGSGKGRGRSAAGY